MSITKRVNYFDRQFLRAEDFRDEQSYHLDRLRRHNRQLHTWGIAEGLTVDAAVGADRAVVEPGTGLDSEGRQIVLDDRRTLPLGDFEGQWVLVVISYDEDLADPAPIGVRQETRWLERPDVKLVADGEGAPPRDLSLRLARLRVSGDGKVAEHDRGVRLSAGVKMSPEATLERLNVMKVGLPSSAWPVLTSGAANRLDLAGNLAVSGTVDGRDISQDGARLDEHLANRSNPHAVTAAQTGALVSVNGVQSPGGNVEIKGGSGVSVTPDAAARSITISTSLEALGGLGKIEGIPVPGKDQEINLAGEGGINVTGDPAAKKITISTSLAALGAPASVGGVTHAGGDIAVAAGNGISVTPDAGAKKITIASTVSLTNLGGVASVGGISSPGGDVAIIPGNGISVTPSPSAKSLTISTSAEAIGAITSATYLRTGNAILTFTQADAENATKPVSVSFLPKMVWVVAAGFSGIAQLNAAGNAYVQSGNGPTLDAANGFHNEHVGSAFFETSTTGGYTSVLVKFKLLPVGGVLNVRIEKSSRSRPFEGTFSFQLAIFCLG